MMRALYILLVASWTYIAISSYFNHQWHHDLDKEHSNLSIAKGLRSLPPQQQTVQVASLIPSKSSYYARVSIKNSTSGNERGQDLARSMLMIHEKREKLKRQVKLIQDKTPDWVGKMLSAEDWCQNHRKNSFAVFTVAMNNDYQRNAAESFVGSLRRTGFDGDIVVAVLAGADRGFIEVLKDYNCIIYTISDTLCKNDRCKFDPSHNISYSINFARYYLYQFWSQRYDENSLILLSDFRDVFFQSNPFNYKRESWGPPKYNIAVFQEAFPNKMIYRCPFNSGWIRNCYGQTAYEIVSDNMVSCSGITIGTRDAILVYSYLIAQQLDPIFRYFDQDNNGPSNVVVDYDCKDNKICIDSDGVDQGFHNFLLHSGQFDSLLDVKRFLQGEGPINTVGAFQGYYAVVNFKSLTDWNVLRGISPNQIFYNWNGDPSPAVHQYDRYSGIRKHLKMLRHVQ